MFCEIKESKVHYKPMQSSQISGVSAKEEARELTMSFESKNIYNYYIPGPKGDQKNQNDVSPIFFWDQCQQVESEHYYLIAGPTPIPLSGFLNFKKEKVHRNPLVPALMQKRPNRKL